MTAAVDWSRLPSNAPPPVRLLLRRCLEKGGTTRLRDIGEARISVAGSGCADPSAGAVSVAPRRSAPVGLPWALALAFVGATLGGALVGLSGLGMWLLDDPQDSRLVVFPIVPPPGVEFEHQRGNQLGTQVAISPDGQTVAFSATSDGQSRVYVRRVDQLEARLLEGTEGKLPLSFSPDGERLLLGDNVPRETATGITQTRTLTSVPLAGGPAVTISAYPGRGASWGSPGFLLLLSPGGPLTRRQRHRLRR